MYLRAILAALATLDVLIISGGIFRVEAKEGFGAGKQEWDYETVRPDAHMFWWLYYTTSKDVIDVYEKPLIIWLQGGPGESSTGHGNFGAIGPLDLDLKPREFSWVNDYNVLLIDNPIGCGYSYTSDPNGYATDNAQIATDLIECIKGFLEKFPKFKKISTYIAGESYGGKMAAEFALAWDQAQKAGYVESNLRGVALADAWISPIESTISRASFMLEMGIIDKNGFERVLAAAQNIKRQVDEENWMEATEVHDDTTVWLFDNVTGGIDFNNIISKVRMNGSGFGDSAITLTKLMNNEVKKSLNVTATWEEFKYEVRNALFADLMKPVTNIVEKLLNDTDIEVVVWNGQLDLVAPPTGTLTWVENLKWSHSSDWLQASRQPLLVDDVIEGYVKEYGNFKMFWVNRAGHMVPKDNPAATQEILRRLTARAE